MGFFKFFSVEFFRESHWLVMALRGAFLAFFLLSIAAVVNTDWRDQLRQWAQVKNRSILATAMGDLMNNGTRVKVVKVRNNKGLFVEIYGAVKSGALPLIDRIALPDKRDGYFHFRGEATNLALKDLNGDKLLEIIAPSFDDQLNANLNVYSFDPESKRFFLYQE